MERADRIKYVAGARVRDRARICGMYLMDPVLWLPVKMRAARPARDYFLRYPIARSTMAASWSGVQSSESITR
jgi:hypothetical protein